LHALLLPLMFATAAATAAEQPAWLASTVYDDYGRHERVLKPWAPLTYGPREVSAWGRTLRWCPPSLLPSQIESQGKELLLGSMQLRLRAGGQDHTVRLERFRFTQRNPNRGCFEATGSAAGVRFRADMWIEYDGFLWLTLRVDGAPAEPVESLHIVAAMPKACATLYQTFCRPLTGWVGDKPIALPWFSNRAENIVNFYHWLGNENLGLGFTYSSLEHWAPASEDEFCTIEPSADAVRYRINLIETPSPLAGKTYSFGIQPTPIKPLPPDYHSMVNSTWNTKNWAAWRNMPDDTDEVIVWPPPQMRGLNDPYHVKPEPLREAVADAHKLGVAVLFTGCPQKVSPLTDEFEQYRGEWLVQPESILDWEGVLHYQNCGNSLALRKWLFYGWTELVRQFDLDGIYYDGWQTGQIACANPAHGCGWTDARGQRHATVPVLAGREFNQRMCMYLEDHVHSPYRPASAPDRGDFPQYHYRIHSWEFVPSVMGFATEWLTGEFAGYPLEGASTLTPEGRFSKCLGLGLLRSRCLSTNWGIPNLFHALMWEHTEDHPTDVQTQMALAWLLPHGIGLGELDYMNQRTVLEVCRAMAEFGTRQADFTPGWRPNPFLAMEHPRGREQMVATWARLDRRQVLAVVSNLDGDRGREMALRWTGPGTPAITDARTGESVPVRHGVIRLRLAPETLRLLRCAW